MQRIVLLYLIYTWNTNVGLTSADNQHTLMRWRKAAASAPLSFHARKLQRYGLSSHACGVMYLVFLRCGPRCSACSCTSCSTSARDSRSVRSSGRLTMSYPFRIADQLWGVRSVGKNSQSVCWTCAAKTYETGAERQRITSMH